MQEPSLQDVYEALWSLVEPGATIAELAQRRALHGLGYVVAAATENGLRPASVDQAAGICRQLIIEAARQFEEAPDSHDRPNEARAVQELLGLRPGAATRTAAVRRAACADWLHMSKAAVADSRSGKNRYEKLIERLADVIFTTESGYQLELIRQSIRAHRRPAETLLSVAWVERFEDYYRAWSPATGLHWDVMLAVEAHQEGNDQRFQRYAYQSLHFYTKYMRAVDRFEEEHGGLWLFPSVVDEMRIASAVWEIGAATPFIPLENSRMRLAVVSGELSPFVAWLQEDGADLSEKWTGWLKECSCEPVRDDGSVNCPVHLVLRAARVFYEGVDRQWDEIADWYKVERPPSTTDPRDGHWREAPGTRHQ
jgi:hypothetical protein